MFEWAVIFIVLASVAAIFGFAGIAITIVSTAKLLFFVFLALAVISFIAAYFQRSRNHGLIIDIKYGD